MVKVLDCPQRSDQCEFQAIGETDEEVLQRAAAHVKNAHDLPPTADLVESLRQAIRET